LGYPRYLHVRISRIVIRDGYDGAVMHNSCGDNHVPNRICWVRVHRMPFNFSNFEIHLQLHG